jgi:hypothetical protein
MCQELILISIAKCDWEYHSPWIGYCFIAGQFPCQTATHLHTCVERNKEEHLEISGEIETLWCWGQDPNHYTT